MTTETEGQEPNKGGRPALYTDPELFEAKIEQYFDQCEEKGRIPTVAGLAFELGFVSRQSLLDYEKRDGFSCAVQRARLRIEIDRSERLVSKEAYTPGLPMDLASNHGWITGKNENDHKSSDRSMSPASWRELATGDAKQED